MGPFYMQMYVACRSFFVWLPESDTQMDRGYIKWSLYSTDHSKVKFSASICCQFIINSTALANKPSIWNCFQLLNSNELTNLRYLIYKSLIVIQQQLLTVTWLKNVSCRTFVSYILKSKELTKVCVKITFQMFQSNLVSNVSIKSWWKLSVSRFDWNFRF